MYLLFVFRDFYPKEAQRIWQEWLCLRKKQWRNLRMEILAK